MKTKGFTLIELLVVIAVIGMLASIVLVSLGPARAKARDARRYSDLVEIQKALELYYDANGRYPASASGGTQWNTVCTKSPPQPYCAYGLATSGVNAYIPELSPYLAALPIDPSGCNTGGCGGYIYRSNGTEYKLAADWAAEVGDQCGVNQHFYDSRCGTSAQCSYCSLSTQGAVNW